MYKGSANDAIWAAGTRGKGTAPWKLKLQDWDLHLVLYDKNSNAQWATGVYKGKNGNEWGINGGYLLVQDDGNLVLYDSNNKKMWESETSG